MSKRSFLRKTAVSLAATVGLGGTTAFAQIVIPPDRTGIVGGGTITFAGTPIGAQSINMGGGVLTLQLDATGQVGFSTLDGRFYDRTNGNPPEASFTSVAGIEALAAEAASVLVADVPLLTSVDFPASPLPITPPLLSATDGQPFLSTGVTMTGGGDPDDSIFAIFEGKLNITAPELYSFWTASDDGSMMWIDINNDGDFADAGENVVSNNLYQGTTRRGSGVTGPGGGVVDIPQEPSPMLAAGSYNVYMAMYEGGGGASIHATWAPGTFATEQLIPLITASATLTNTVNVTANSTINMAAGGLNVALGTLNLSSGATLTKNGGAPLSFTSTNVGASSGINVAAGTLTTGAITGGPITTFTKTGSGTLLAVDNSKASGFAATSTLDLRGGTFIGLSRSGPDATTPLPATIGDAKIRIDGGTFVGRQVSYGGAVPTAGRVAVTFYNLAPAVAQLDPIDSGAGLLAVAAASGKTFNWPGPLAFDDNNPDFGHPNFDAVSGGFVGVDNLEVSGFGKATFTNDPTHGSKYSFGTWSDDGVVVWIDLDNDGTFEKGDNGSGKNELVHDDNTFHAPQARATQGVEIPAGTYRMAAGFYEGGGNAVMDFYIARGSVGAASYDELKANFRQIGPHDTSIISKFESLNPGGPMFGLNADFTKNPVTVVSTGGLGGEGLVQYGDVNLTANSNLTVSGSIKIANTIIDGKATMTFLNDLDFGKLQPATAGAPFTLLKAGGADVNLKFKQTSALGSNATIGVTEGRLLATGATTSPAAPSSLGAAKLLMAGGTFVPQGGGFALPADTLVPGGENTLTEYFYNNNVNFPETVINPIYAQSGLFGLSPTQKLSLTGPIGGAGAEYNDAYAQTRWGDQETLASMWFGDMTFTTDATSGNVYSFWSNTDDGSTWWIDLNDDGVFGAGEMVLDNNVYQGPTARRGLERVGGSATTTVPPGTHKVAFAAYEGGGGMLFEFKLGRGDIASYADAALQFVNPAVTSIATYRARTYTSVDNFSVPSFTATPVDVTANSTIDSQGSSKLGAVTFLNTSTLTFTTSGSQLASASTASGVGTLQNNVGPNRLQVVDVGASAGATTQFSGNDAQVLGSLTGTGTVKSTQGTLEFTRNGAAATGNPLLDIGGGSTMRFNPGASGTFGAAAITNVNNLGTLQAAAGTTDLSGATINTPAILAGLLGGRVPGGLNVTDIPTAQGVDTHLSRAHTGDVGFFGGNGGTWVYRGEIKIPDTDGDGTPGPVAFGEQFDDFALLKIDGATLINNNAWNTPASSGELELVDTEPDGVGTAGDGWFTFEARFGDSGGGVGPAGQLGWNIGFGMDSNPADGFDLQSQPLNDPNAVPVPIATVTQYVEPFDNGTMNLFRTAPAPDMGQVRVLTGATLRVGSVVGANTVDIAADSRLQLNGAGTSKINASALSIAGTAAAPTGTLDVNNSAIVLDYPTGGPTAGEVADVRSRIVAGRGGTGLGKTWNGKGITSTAAGAAAVNSMAVGYAVNGQLPLGAYTTFRGQPVDPSSILARFTRTGDANLDGVVNNDDVTIVGANYAPGSSKPRWDLGDFDFNGFVDDDDVTLLGVYYNPAATPIPAPNGVAAVPEPSTWLMLTIGGLGAGLAGWRRRKKA